MIRKQPFAVLLFITLGLVSVSSFTFGQRNKRKKTSDELSETTLREAEFFFMEAEKYFILGNYTKSLLYFKRVVELNSLNATAHYKIAEILAKRNNEDDLTKASISIETAIRLDKSNKYFYVLAATIQSNLTNFSKAAQHLETMIKAIKGTEKYLYQLAAIYQYGNKNDDAIKTYDRAEMLLGVNEISSLQKQRIYFEQGKTKEAIIEGEKLLEAFPNEEGYVMTFAEVLSQQKQFKKAIEIMERFISTHPEAGNSKILLAGFYRDNGQEEKAQSFIKEVFDDPAIDMSSKIIIVGIYATTIDQQTKQGHVDTSLRLFTINLFKRLLLSYPNEPNVHIVGGDIYLSLGRNEDAKTEYLAAIQNGSTSFEAYQNLLFLESELNEYDSIISHSEQGLEIFPNQAMLYYFNGYANSRKANHKEAAYALEQAKRLSSSNLGLVSEINSLLGDTYNQLKEYKKSDLSYDAVLKFNPDNDLILNNYSYYLALRNEYLDKAEKMSGRAVKNNPTNNSYLDTYAWVLYARGKYKEARKVMEKIIQTDPSNSTFFEHYGDILYKMGDVENAVKQWEKAKSLDGNNELIDKKIANRRLY